MNEYGRMAMRHWRQFLPSRYATLTDPTSFFATLGQEVSDEIQDLQDQILASMTLSEDYLTNVGQRNMARMRAREQVLAERVLLPPENPEPEPEPYGLEPEDPRIDPDGMPTDETHPLWRDLEDESISVEEFLARARTWRASVRTNPQQSANR